LARPLRVLPLLYRKLNQPPAEIVPRDKLTTVASSDEQLKKAFTVNEKLTSLEDITNYNNFYEFSSNKQAVASAAKGFVDTTLERFS